MIFTNVAVFLLVVYFCVAQQLNERDALSAEASKNNSRRFHSSGKTSGRRWTNLRNSQYQREVWSAERDVPESKEVESNITEATEESERNKEKSKKIKRLTSRYHIDTQNSTESPDKVNNTRHNVELGRSRGHRDYSNTRRRRISSESDYEHSTSSSNKRRRMPTIPTTTNVPQTMSYSLYNYFRPLEQDVPQDDILPFLDFGRKLSPVVPTPSGVNSIENKSTVSRLRIHVPELSVTPTDDETLHEEMDLNFDRRVIERNSVPRGKLHPSPNISNLYRKPTSQTTRTADNVIITSDCLTPPSLTNNTKSKKHPRIQDQQIGSRKNRSICGSSEVEAILPRNTRVDTEDSVKQNLRKMKDVEIISNIKTPYKSSELKLEGLKSRSAIAAEPSNVKAVFKDVQGSDLFNSNTKTNSSTHRLLKNSSADLNESTQEDLQIENTRKKNIQVGNSTVQRRNNTFGTFHETPLPLSIDSSYSNKTKDRSVPTKPIIRSNFRQPPLAKKTLHGPLSQLRVGNITSSNNPKNTTEPELKEFSDRQNITESNMNDFKNITKRKERLSANTTSSPDSQNPKILSTAVVTSVSVQESSNSSAPPTEAPMSNNKTADLKLNNTDLVSERLKVNHTSIRIKDLTKSDDERIQQLHQLPGDGLDSENKTVKPEDNFKEDLMTTTTTQAPTTTQSTTTPTPSTITSTTTPKPSTTTPKPSTTTPKPSTTTPKPTTTTPTPSTTSLPTPSSTTTTPKLIVNYTAKEIPAVDSIFKNLTANETIPTVTEKPVMTTLLPPSVTDKVPKITLKNVSDISNSSNQILTVNKTQNTNTSSVDFETTIIPTTYPPEVINTNEPPFYDTTIVPIIIPTEETTLPKEDDLDLPETVAPAIAPSPTLVPPSKGSPTDLETAVVKEEKNNITAILTTGDSDVTQKPHNWVVTGDPEEDVEVAYQEGIGVTTYILVFLGVVPIVLGATVAGRFLVLHSRKKVLDESEYSSEYNRSPLGIGAASPLPTKLPRVPTHLGWEMEKSAPNILPTTSARWEFPREKLRLQTLLGQGNFGQVWKAEADDISGHEGLTRLVAVKTVKESANTREREDLLRELGIMQDLGSHPNVVTLLGCCTEKEPYFLIMEYVMYGKLLAFLRDHRTRAHYYNFSDATDALTSRDLTVFAYCVARGMDYLSNKGIIHRDLAARNILVDHNKLCKIADFGMSRNVRDTGQIYEQRQSKGALPIRWMAPESLHFSLFTHKSDVWSYGILMWEIVTLGSTPYATMGAREVMRRVRDGYRLERPSHCRMELFRVISRCWQPDPNKRPTFAELKQEIGQLLGDTENGGGYVDLESLADEIKQGMHNSSSLQRKH